MTSYLVQTRTGWYRSLQAEEAVPIRSCGVPEKRECRK